MENFILTIDDLHIGATQVAGGNQSS